MVVLTSQDVLLCVGNVIWLITALMAVMYRNIETTEQYYINIITNKLLKYVDIDKLDLDFKESVLGM